jgi:hypothetical protein
VQFSFSFRRLCLEGFWRFAPPLPHVPMAATLMSAVGRKLLVSSSSANTTYIALAVIFGALAILSVTCCIIYGRCCCWHSKKGVLEVEQKDFDLTSVLSGGTSRGTLPSFSSAATSPGRMAQAIARENGSVCSANSASLPGSPNSASWRDKVRPNNDALDMQPATAVQQKPSPPMGMLRGQRATGRRPGGLPTIPSVNSMGSATRSDVSDAGAPSHIGLLTDHSITNSHLCGHQTDRSLTDPSMDSDVQQETPHDAGDEARVNSWSSLAKRSGPLLQHGQKKGMPSQDVTTAGQVPTPGKRGNARREAGRSKRLQPRERR